MHILNPVAFSWEMPKSHFGERTERAPRWHVPESLYEFAEMESIVGENSDES